LVEDIIKSLGYLCLGSRFRRIGERLQADTQQIIEELGVSIQAAQYPFLSAIDRAGPLTIGELAQAVGITQPGATRTVSQLLELGYVDMLAAPEDQRRRMISLTPKGQGLVDYSKQVVWPRIVSVAGLGFVFAPLNVAAYLYTPRELRGAAGP